MALLIIPAGIIAWVILWQFGLVASIVAFGVAIGALWLYRFGSGGRISRTGAIRVTIITIVTLLLSFLAGLVADVVPLYASQRNIDIVSALTSSEFWTFFNHALANNIGNVAVPAAARPGLRRARLLLGAPHRVRADARRRRDRLTTSERMRRADPGARGRPERRQARPRASGGSRLPPRRTARRRAPRCPVMIVSGAPTTDACRYQ